jgi:hypothetical protein
VRKTLNENPLVQAAVVGVLAIAVGLIFMMQMSGGGGEAAPTDTGVTTPVTDTSATAPPATGTDPGAAAATPAPPATGTEAAPPAAGGALSDFQAGPGLPKEVVSAYDAGDAVVLLIVNKDGIDDKRLEATIEELRSNPDAAVFVTDVKDVAKYSRITEGVDVDRTPALVIVQPKRLTEGTMPAATVAYGFRGAASARQALEDALYNGPQNLPYHP